MSARSQMIKIGRRIEPVGWDAPRRYFLAVLIDGMARREPRRSLLPSRTSTRRIGNEWSWRGLAEFLQEARVLAVEFAERVRG